MLTLSDARNAVTRRRLLLTAVFVASGVAAVAGSFLVAGRGPTFVVTALAATLLYLTPDGLLAWGILTLGKHGRPLLVAGAVATSVLLFTGVAAGATSFSDALTAASPSGARRRTGPPAPARRRRRRRRARGRSCRTRG